VFVDGQRQITQLFDLQADPWERHNLIDQREGYATVLKKFQAILESMPKQDPAPRYRRRAANAWDRKVRKDRK